MSNNQWNCDRNLPAWKAMGEDCSADARMPGLVRAYKQVLPDVIGLQEVSRHMQDLVTSQMRTLETENGETAHYDFITGGYTPILYRDDKLKLIESGFCRYAETVPGFQGIFNDSGSKSYSFGVFQEKDGGKGFILMSTHLWWKSDDPSVSQYQEHSGAVRAMQITQAIDAAERLIGKYHYPGLILGDFNAEMDSPCMRTVQEKGWEEAYYLTNGPRDETKGHHYCYADGYKPAQPSAFTEAIDHIIVQKTTSVRINSYQRVLDAWFNKLSDHYPLYVDITL